MRLINVPGRGASLSDEDYEDALEALQDIYSTEVSAGRLIAAPYSVYFETDPAKPEYTFGPGGDFDTSRFNLGACVEIESAYFRQATYQAFVDESFDTAGAWVLGTGWTIAGGKLRSDGTQTAQSLASLNGILTAYQVNKVAYRIASLDAGYIQLQVGGTTGPLREETGTYYEEIETGTDDTDFDIIASENFIGTIEYLHILGSLPEGTDYVLHDISQRRYARVDVKGSGGRPDGYWFTRDFPLPRVRFEYHPIENDTFVAEIIAAIPFPSDLDQAFDIHGDARKFLRHQLAIDLAPEYSKTPSQTVVRNRDEAFDMLYALNSRIEPLRFDRALQPADYTLHIDRGDP